MDRGQLSSRIAALRVECAAVGRALAEGGRGLSAEACFELAGQAQQVANAADGLVAVAGALGARVELALTGSGPVERTHPVGFVDAMAPAEMALATGVTEGLAGRKVALGAALSQRFPLVRDLVLAGEFAVSSAHKVVDACAGLDIDACEKVDAELAPRLAGMDPAGVTSATRAVAARVAADQVAAQAARTRRGRTVEVRPSVDGLTDWFALLPTATSAAAWSAVDALAAEYRSLDDSLTLGEARADAFGDLLLRNVQVSARVTLGVPVVTGAPEPAGAAVERIRVERDDDETVMDAVTGDQTRFADLDAASREEMSWVEISPEPDGDIAATLSPVSPGFAVSGTALPGLGWVEPHILAGLLRTLPVEVARAVLEAETGTQLSHASGAYRPPQQMRDFVTTRDGTCRMWGCTRRAEHTDLDHTRPWPTGPTTPGNLVALCRRHHRMKQQGRWRPTLADDGTLTWTSRTGTVRTTEPQHREVLHGSR